MDTIIERIEIRIRNEGYANAHLEPTIWLNRNPSGLFVYEPMVVDEDITLYLAEYQGLVSFFSHDRRNEHGYGGQTFTLDLTDGSRADVKGPWSSRCEVMNEFYDIQSIEATWHTPDYRTGIAGAITIPVLREYIDRHHLPFTVERGDRIVPSMAYRLEPKA